MAAEATEPEDVTRTAAWAAMRLRNVSRLWSPWMHDLRQPLHTVSLNLELLSRSLGRDPAAGGEAEERKRYLDVIRRRLDELQEGLQTYTDLLRPPGDEGLSFDAARLSREIGTLIEPLARREGLEVELDADPARIDLNGRREAVRDLLLAATLKGVESLATGGVVLLRVGIDGGRGFIQVSRSSAASSAASAADGPVEGPDEATSRSRPGAGDLEVLARDLAEPLGGAATADGDSNPDHVLRIELPLAGRGTATSETGEA